MTNYSYSIGIRKKPNGIRAYFRYVSLVLIRKNPTKEYSSIKDRYIPIWNHMLN